MHLYLIVSAVGTAANAITFTGDGTEITRNIVGGPIDFTAQEFEWSGYQDGRECLFEPLRTNTGGDNNYHHLNCRLEQFSRIDGTRFDLSAITLSTTDNVQLFESVPAFMPELRAFAPFYDPKYYYFDNMLRYNELGQAYVAHEKASPLEGGERFSLQGYRDGELVAQTQFGVLDPATTLELAGFTDIDAFSFDLDTSGVKTMWNHYYRDFGHDYLEAGTLFCPDFICLEVQITSFEYAAAATAPVPLPASAWLLGLGLLGLAGFKRKAA